jgi:hypothetical protein
MSDYTNYDDAASDAIRLAMLDKTTREYLAQVDQIVGYLYHADAKIDAAAFRDHAEALLAERILPWLKQANEDADRLHPQSIREEMRAESGR